MTGIRNKEIEALGNSLDEEKNPYQKYLANQNLNMWLQRSAEQNGDL